MESNKGYDNLLEVGFIPEQIERLRRLRCIHVEREQAQLTMERYRLEFARWLVSTGRLTDAIPETRAH